MGILDDLLCDVRVLNASSRLHQTIELLGFLISVCPFCGQEEKFVWIVFMVVDADFSESLVLLVLLSELIVLENLLFECFGVRLARFRVTHSKIF